MKQVKKIYSLRKITVEPVIGNIKQNIGFREFMLKGYMDSAIQSFNDFFSYILHRK